MFQTFKLLLMEATFKKPFYVPIFITAIKPGCVAHFGAFFSLRHCAVYLTNSCFMQ